MQRFFVLLAAMLGIVVFSAPAPVRAQSKVLRHLVYDYTYGVKQDSIQENDEMSTGQLTSDLGGSGSDKGQIAIDVNGVEPDGGLVVEVSETSRSNRSTKPVTCVVYPDTSVVCAGGDAHPEEDAVLRVLSPKFFDASNLDANRHWKVTAASAGLTIDFTATPNADGVTLGITSERHQKASNGSSVDANAKYQYDTAKLVATSISDYQTARQQNGAGAYSTVVIEVTATLVSDSGIAKN